MIFVLVLKELEDSFLVLLASTLTSDGSYVDGKLLTERPMMRLFKSNITFMSDPEPDHRFYYFRHLAKYIDKVPEFFTPERKAFLDHILATGPAQEGGKGNSSPVPKDDFGVEPSKVHPYRETTRH